MEASHLGKLKIRQLKKMRLVYRNRRRQDFLGEDQKTRQAIHKAIRLKQINYYEKQELAFESRVFKYLNQLNNSRNY